MFEEYLYILVKAAKPRYKCLYYSLQNFFCGKIILYNTFTFCVNVFLKALTVNCKVQSLPVVSQDPKAPGSPTSLRVSPAGACDDLDMETEEEDELRTRGYSSLEFSALFLD